MSGYSDTDCFLDGFPETYAMSSTVAENERKQWKTSFRLYSRLPPIDKIPSLSHTHRPWCVPAVAVAIPGRTSLTLRGLVRVHGKRRLWWHIRCHMTNTGLVSPRVCLFDICVNTSDDGCTTPAFTRFRRRGLGWWCYISWCTRGYLGAVAISLQNFLGRDIGAGREQSGVIEDES